MPAERAQQIQWQPIGALPLLATMIDGLLDEVNKQCGNLQSCRSKPHVLDNDTVNRVVQVYAAQSRDLELYEEQLSRWKILDITASQRREVERLAARIPSIRERIAAILSLAEELKGGTIETILAKSDLELGLEVLLGKRKP